MSPRARPRRWSHLALPGLLSLLFVARCTGGFREDELECEQAVHQLQKCCPNFELGSIDCNYSDGCGVSYPSLTIEDSECIENESCETLVATHVCARAMDAQPIRPADGGSDFVDGAFVEPHDAGLSEHPQVCP